MFNWQAFSAIGTWVAIMVALFIPYWQNRRRLILRIIPNRCAILNVNEVIPYIDISAVNAGTSDVVISGWGICIEGSSEMIFHVATQDDRLCSIFDPKLPLRLSPGDSFSCGIPRKEMQNNLKSFVQKGALQIDDWLVVKISDSCGKVYEKPLKMTIQEFIDLKGA